MGAGVVSWYWVVGIIFVKLSNYNALEQTLYGVIKGILDKCGVFAYIQTIKNEVVYDANDNTGSGGVTNKAFRSTKGGGMPHRCKGN